jgi:serine/threonine protein kinase
MRLTFVLPYYHSSDLNELRLFREYFLEREARAIGCQLFTALSLLHKEGIWHGEVSCANIFVVETQKPLIYLTPFSLTSWTRKSFPEPGQEGEQFHADVWNGVKLLYIILCGEELEEAVNPQQIDTLFSFSPWQLHSNSSKMFFRYMHKCWTKGQMSSAIEVLQHPWLLNDEHEH